MPPDGQSASISRKAERETMMDERKPEPNPELYADEPLAVTPSIDVLGSFEVDGDTDEAVVETANRGQSGTRWT